MAISVHTREEAIALLSAISAEQWREGIVIFNPHRERQVRKERNKRVSFQLWPESLANRATNLLTHLKKKYGGDLGLEIACLRLETPHKSEGEME